ncbi:MAG: hypothetical protein L0241_05240 [Planctomycetia bacterium]|nr:hypothetical protein [Planctomycetia bacterium]
MRIWIAPVVTLVSFLAGCTMSGEGGTPGSAASFTISAPAIPPTIRQDNKETVNLKINRGADFKKDVKLTVSAPEKVKAELNKDTVKASDSGDFTVTLAPGKDAPVGEHKVKVTGTPDGSGAPATVEFTLKVEKNP